jgi:hypothetical protein
MPMVVGAAEAAGTAFMIWKMTTILQKKKN